LFFGDTIGSKIQDKLVVAQRKQEYIKQDQEQQREIIKLEKDLEREREMERDQKQLALIRGKSLRYKMTTKEVEYLAGNLTLNLRFC
jgi:hypothetical protein